MAVTWSSNMSTSISFTETKFDFSFKIALRQLRQEGNIVYEYNPLRNLRLEYDLYVSNEFGELVDSNDNPITYKGITLTNANIKNLIRNNEFDNIGLDSDRTTELIQSLGYPVQVRARAGTLVDFETELLGVDLEHPVQIECQPSYDGSVNLILNDDKNPPRLINSRFTCLEDRTYKIIERFGNNNTNIYDDKSFDVDTSLYKRITQLPELTFEGIESGGNLKVGNYVYYFKFIDSDGNETDYVAESGIVTAHIGNVNDPFSIRGGLKDENSSKMVKFMLTNIDSSYDYVRVYYTRSTSDIDGIEVTTAHFIDKKYVIKDQASHIVITGLDPEQDISLDDINTQYNIVDAAKTQAQCQNMLFLGNVYKPTVPYKELKDLALRFYPFGYNAESIGNVDPFYNDDTGGYEYYNATNLYNTLGYWDKEPYRTGIVFILPDYSLTPVFNTRGRDNVPILNNRNASEISKYYTEKPVFNYDSIDNNGEYARLYVEYNEEDYSVIGDDGKNSPYDLENVKGVIRLNSESTGATQIAPDGTVTPFGIRFAIQTDALTELKKYVKGFFFVRQKRIPTILAQACTIGLDLNSHLPVVNMKPVQTSGVSVSPYHMLEGFVNSSRILDHDFIAHGQQITNVKPYAAICPEAELSLPKFNQIFTGASFSVGETRHQPRQNYFESDVINNRFLYLKDGYQLNTASNNIYTNVKITLIEDNMKLVNSGTQKFAARAGDAEEAWRVLYAGRDVLNDRATNMLRGSYGTYIGTEGYNRENKIINIYTPGYDTALIEHHFNVRYGDESPYYAITDRYSIDDEVFNTPYTSIDSNGEHSFVEAARPCYRGDCYIGNFTHRIVRNFQDPESPINSTIVDENTWLLNYSYTSNEQNAEINRADVNAVQLGHWVTFKVCANINISMRDLDRSNYSEEGLTGRPRAFYPLYKLSVTGESKIPESSIINGGISSTTSDRYNFNLPDVPYIKNEFDTRIIYSNIHINDAFVNGYRNFKLTNFQDYSRVYGGIVSLVEFQGNLICVFETGVALIPVNERAVAAEGSGGLAYINTSKVLPENPLMINTNYGSAWQESVCVTPNYVYGVDTIAKRIWRTDGKSFETISDFRINKFLNDYISLTELEKTPVIGVRNVKTHYNAHKQDIMFTFYDNLYGFEENVWNICYNEILNNWVTLYSWVPSYSANINNIFFSFDRNTSKAITKLGITKADSTSADGITLSNVLISSDTNYIGDFSITDRNIPESKFDINTIITYTLELDNFKNYKHFEIVNNRLYYKAGEYSNLEEIGEKVILLNVKANINAEATSDDDNIAQYINGWKEYIRVNRGYFQNTIAVVLRDNVAKLTTDFWKHGESGIIDIADKIEHTKWYGKVHPFEFEVIVADKPGVHKIFENLYIISNKEAPESFHYEIVGEVYNFHEDKANMYYRQEATKELYQNLGSDILFNRDYKEDVIPKWNKKSTILPLYYERIDTFDEIYDSYQLKTSKFSKDYQNLTGTELVYDNRLNEFRLATHVKGNDIMKVGRLQGNMQYKEDLWNVEIRPMNYRQKNESEWNVPPIILNNVPNDLTKEDIDNSDLPDKYDITDLEVETGWSSRKEARIRDKYIRIKIRYTGYNKATITALRTLYSISYA